MAAMPTPALAPRLGGEACVIRDALTHGALLITAPHLVPAQLADRSVPLAAIWVGPGEITAFGATGAAAGLHYDDSRLAELVVTGLSANAIADELHVSPRTVQRRLARLRARVGARSHGELVAMLARPQR